MMLKNDTGKGKLRWRNQASKDVPKRSKAIVAKDMPMRGWPREES
jgi:hypothetical protein